MPRERRREVVDDREGRPVEVYSQVRHSAEVRRCSFCGKREDQVFKLIEGPGVAICDECVDVVHDVVVKARANLDTR